MRLQHWTYRLARINKEKSARDSGELAPEVLGRLYEGLAEHYSPLRADRQEIRTIIIAPAGNFEDDIHCRLSTPLSLLDDEPPLYEALSYAWGDSRTTNKCFIQGVRHQITQNLGSALRHLRSKDQPRVLWIDALCIDQGNVNERNSQVKFMGTVYRKATRVIAWLGPEYNNSDLAFEFFNAMPSDAELHWDPLLLPSVSKVLTMSHIDAIKDLFHRAWWKRVWTVQESVLAQNLLFVCGRQELLAEQAFSVSVGYFRHIYWCCQPIWHSHLNTEAGLGDCCDTLSRLAEMRTHNNEYTFGEILTKFMPRHSSDPRDKIYGLVGLASKNEAALVIPDYSKPVDQVYEEVALKLTEITRELRILSMKFPRAMVESASAIQNLPSWAPNWAMDVEAALLYDLEDRLSCLGKYQASGGSRNSAQYVDEGKLAVRGYIIGRIAVLSNDEHHWQIADLASFFRRWREMLGIPMSPNRPYGKTGSDTTFEDAYWQTLCCSVIPSRTHPRNVNLMHRTSDKAYIDKLWYEIWWDWCETYNCQGSKLPLIREKHQESDYTEAEINSMGGLISTSISMRRLFVSDSANNWIGLVPMDAQVGDLVVLLEGGRVPYIVRSAGEDGNNLYHLIGDTYIHGLMDGEEWNQQKSKEIVLV